MRDKRLAIVYWFLIGVLLFYIVYFTIYLDKGYQTFSVATGTVTSKIKGTAFSYLNQSSQQSQNNDTNQRRTIFDAIDLSCFWFIFCVFAMFLSLCTVLVSSNGCLQWHSTRGTHLRMCEIRFWNKVFENTLKKK